MAVSKTTRFQVLKRDAHTCRYCGASAPDVKLAVDHVIPATLGGSDKPDNLVAACMDCNAGKGASNPDSELVQQLSAEAATYALAMANKAVALEEAIASERRYLQFFEDAWNNWTFGDHAAPLPPTYKGTIRRWHDQGIPTALIEYAIDVAMENRSVKLRDIFRYACGVVYRRLESADVSFALAGEGQRLYAESDIDDAFSNGRAFESLYMTSNDFVARHIDQGLAPSAYSPIAARLQSLLVGSDLARLEAERSG